MIATDSFRSTRLRPAELESVYDAPGIRVLRPRTDTSRRTAYEGLSGLTKALAELGELFAGATEIGACCFPTGLCLVLTPEECEDLGGVYLGEGVGADESLAAMAYAALSLGLFVGRMGGDCLNVGCVPSKGIISAARAWHAARTADRFGGPVAEGAGDFVPGEDAADDLDDHEGAGQREGDDDTLHVAAAMVRRHR